MDGHVKRDCALFGFRGREVWVSDEAFVTQQDGALLVERWVGASVISVLVRPEESKSMAAVWARLSALAVKP